MVVSIIRGGGPSYLRRAAASVKMTPSDHAIRTLGTPCPCVVRQTFDKHWTESPISVQSLSNVCQKSVQVQSMSALCPTQIQCLSKLCYRCGEFGHRLDLEIQTLSNHCPITSFTLPKLSDRVWTNFRSGQMLDRL